MSANPARQQAARWFARMQGGPAVNSQRDDFDRWLRADPRHQTEYNAFNEVWRDFDSTPRAEALASATRQTQARARRQLLRGGLGLLVMGSTGVLGWHLWEQGQNAVLFAVSPQTQTGQIARQTLPDGSHITLSGGSAVQVRYSARQRTVALPVGEAVFDVAKDVERPFVISSGAARITVLGTRFVVSRLPGLVRVSVASGSVRVALANAPEAGSPTVLQAGEVAEIADHQPPDQAIHRVQRSAADAFAFESGTVVFDRASLAELAATLSRYRREPVRWAGNNGASQALVTAVVQLRNMEGFLRSLPEIAPVRVRQQNGEMVLTPR